LLKQASTRTRTRAPRSHARATPRSRLKLYAACSSSIMLRTGKNQRRFGITPLLIGKQLHMAELNHECGIAAIYHFDSPTPSPLAPPAGPEHVSRLMPRLLLDLQNRGQLAAGFSTFNP